MVRKTGAIWHGTVEGHPDIDERGLTEDVARRKVEELLARRAEARTDVQPGTASGIAAPLRTRRERRRR